MVELYTVNVDVSGSSPDSYALDAYTFKAQSLNIKAQVLKA